MEFGDRIASLTDRMLSDPKAAIQAPKPGIEEWWIKSHPEYDGKRSDWEFACSEIR